MINGRNFGPLRDDSSEYWWLHNSVNMISVKIRSQATQDDDGDDALTEFDGVCTSVSYLVENLYLTCDYPECTIHPLFSLFSSSI